MAKGNFVAYYRVSTQQQGTSGLGLEAQRERVEAAIAQRQGRLVAAFTEIETGKRIDRPELQKALAECRLRRAVLIVAKLDRLARNARFVIQLRDGLGDDGVLFCDLPELPSGPIGKLIVGVLALIAEFEAGMISQRTKAALAVVKARGVKLGNPHLVGRGSRAGAYRARRARMHQARQRAADVAVYIDQARQAGCLTLAAIAEALTNRGIPTPGGESIWTPTGVGRVLQAIEKI